jgi:multiple sugar transport system permease protein
MVVGKRNPVQKIGHYAAHAVLMVGALLMVMPMIWMVVTSFKPPPEIALWPPLFWPRHPTTENYTGAFEAAPFGRFFANSVAYAVVCTLSVLTTSLVAGSVFGKYRFPLRGLLFGLVLATAIVPFEAYMIPLYLQLVQVDWINTVQGIVLPYLFMAFGIFLMRQHVSSAIPNELMEAGRVDGAGEWWLLRRVIAPLSGNALAAVAILAFNTAWAMLIWPLLVANDQSLFNMELGLTTFQFAFSNDTGKLMAGSVVSVVPMLIVFLLMRRRIIENMALTGLKG